MCGIVGVAGNLFARDVDVFNEMLFADTVRGDHSTGVAAVTNGLDATSIMKAVGPAYELQGMKKYDSIVNAGKRVLIGHNRYGTMGARVARNAHPFDFDNVCGVHNGTVDYDSKRAMHNHDEFDTDSEAIFSNINAFGPDETIPKLDGAWALCWYDKPYQTLNFIRNDKRPLWYAFDKDLVRLYWASEAGMLSWILARKGVEVFEGKMHQFETNMWYEFEIPKGAAKWDKPRVEKLEGRPPKPPTTTSVYGTEGYAARRQAQQDARFQSEQRRHGFNGYYRNGEWHSFDKGEVPVQETKKEAAPTTAVPQTKALTVVKPATDVWGWIDGETWEQRLLRIAELTEAVKEDVDDDTMKDLEKSLEAIQQELELKSKPKTPVTLAKSFNYKIPGEAEHLTQEEFNVHTKHGCVWCQNNINWGSKALFLKVEGLVEVFCQECVEGNDPTTQAYIRGAK